MKQVSFTDSNHEDSLSKLLYTDWRSAQLVIIITTEK